VLTFQLEHPLQQKDINAVIESNQKQNTLVNKKLQKVGLFVLIVTIIGGYLWGIRFDKPTDFNKIMTLFLPFTFGAFSLLHPYIRNFVFGRPSSDHLTFDYLPANVVTNHKCEAFIRMPGMEKYKKYVKLVS
jgi:hypothetical protein